MKKFGGPGAGSYEKNTDIGEIPAVRPCDVKGLNLSKLLFPLESGKISPEKCNYKEGLAFCYALSISNALCDVLEVLSVYFLLEYQDTGS